MRSVFSKKILQLVDQVIGAVSTAEPDNTQLRLVDVLQTSSV